MESLGDRLALRPPGKCMFRGFIHIVFTSSLHLLDAQVVENDPRGSHRWEEAVFIDKQLLISAGKSLI